MSAAAQVAGDDAPQSARGFTRVDVAVGLGLAAAYLLLVRRFWFVTDDAYISFRYARNLAEGLGLRFNPGESPPVEGYSNFLWVLLCALIERLGGSVEFWPLLVSAACGAMLVFLVYRTLRVRLELPRVPAVGAAAIFALFPPLAVYGTSGLATVPFSLCVFLAFDALVLRAAPGGFRAGVFGLLAALLRTEGIYWCVVLLAVAGLSRRLRGERFGRAAAAFAGIVGAGFAAYFLWRFNYHGGWIANTAAAKSGVSVALLARGAKYVGHHALTFVTPVLVLPAIAFALRRERRGTGVAVALLALAFPAFAVVVSGDFMAMGRFLLPGWAFAALVFGWMLADLACRSAARSGAAAAVVAVLCATQLAPGWDLHVAPESVRAALHFRYSSPEYQSEYAQWRAQRDNAKTWAVQGRALRRWLPPDARVLVGPIGAIGYYSRLFLFDRYGLVMPDVARRVAPAEKLRSPGHDREAPLSYFLEHAPDALFPGTAKLPPNRAEWGPRLSAFVQAVAASLRAEAPTIASRYVPDFRPIPDWEFGGPDQYLLYWRRIEEGESPAAAWGALEARLREFGKSPDPDAAMVEDGYPRPRGVRRTEGDRR